MKLLRFGNFGQEKPGIMADDGTNQRLFGNLFGLGSDIFQ